MARIVLIEDDHTILDTLTRALRHLGHAVWSYGDTRRPLADDALEQADVLIADWVDGAADLISAAKACGRPTPVLVITGQLNAEPQARLCGAEAVLLKPFLLPELEAAIDSLVREGTEEREA